MPKEASSTRPFLGPMNKEVDFFLLLSYIIYLSMLILSLLISKIYKRMRGISACQKCQKKQEGESVSWEGERSSGDNTRPFMYKSSRKCNFVQLDLAFTSRHHYKAVFRRKFKRSFGSCYKVASVND